MSDMFNLRFIWHRQKVVEFKSPLVSIKFQLGQVLALISIELLKLVVAIVLLGLKLGFQDWCDLQNSNFIWFLYKLVKFICTQLLRLLEFVRSFVELPVQHFSDILILYGQKLVNLLFPLSLLRLELTVFLFCQFFESFGPVGFLSLELAS